MYINALCTTNEREFRALKAGQAKTPLASRVVEFSVSRVGTSPKRHFINIIRGLYTSSSINRQMTPSTIDPLPHLRCICIALNLRTSSSHFLPVASEEQWIRTTGK